MVVFNNGSLGFVELEMKATGFLSHATDLVNPDFAKIAEGTGILGCTSMTRRRFGRRWSRPSRMTVPRWWILP
jgi:thiamine pyrophosphate-dependent acetolactate synthase large subunit-like protein